MRVWRQSHHSYQLTMRAEYIVALRTDLQAMSSRQLIMVAKRLLNRYTDGPAKEEAYLDLYRLIDISGDDNDLESNLRLFVQMYAYDERIQP